MNAKTVMAGFYRRAQGDPKKLPWYQKQPQEFLNNFLPTGKGKALDVGCGSGEHLVWLAKKGFEATGIDMFDEAQSMALKLADQNNVTVNFNKTDLFAYNPSEKFDLVYDSGCLHSLVGGNRELYKQKVNEWLKPGGTFVLMHWGKRHIFDWRPIGPIRKSKVSIIESFEKEMKFEKYQHHDFKADFPFGPVVRGMCFKFTKK